MPDPVFEEIRQGFILLNEGKEEKALQLVTDIEHRKDLSIKDTLVLLNLKANTFVSRQTFIPTHLLIFFGILGSSQSVHCLSIYLTFFLESFLK